MKCHLEMYDPPLGASKGDKKGAANHRHWGALHSCAQVEEPSQRNNLKLHLGIPPDHLSHPWPHRQQQPPLTRS